MRICNENLTSSVVSNVDDKFFKTYELRITAWLHHYFLISLFN